jgi:hypothetical protein
MENLTVDQRQALNQLRTLANGADDEVAMGVLESVDWDVQVTLLASDVIRRGLKFS